MVPTGATRHYVSKGLLSSSDRPEDVAESYAGGANSYVTKPASLSELREGVQELAKYWIDVSALPTR